MSNHLNTFSQISLSTGALPGNVDSRLSQMRDVGPTFLVPILLLLLSSFSCMEFRTGDRELQREMDGLGIPLTLTSIQTEMRNIRLMKLENPGAPVVVFLHGAPGSIDDWQRYFQDPKINGSLTMVAVDRPGYGFSDFGKPELDLERQADLILSALESELGDQRFWLVAHSFGGPVALAMALRAPELVEGQILLAASLSAEAEPVFWFNYPASWGWLNWIFPRTLVMANEEKFSHFTELEKQRLLLPKLEVPTFIIQGTEDGLVPLENAFYAQREMPTEVLQVLIIPKEDHFLPWTRYQMVSQLLQTISVGEDPSTLLANWIETGNLPPEEQ